MTTAIIDAAKAGDKDALHALVVAVQDQVHRLAMRMLADPQLAQDATQEILIRVITKLSQFEGQSRFETWVYRVATNYLLTARKVIARDPGLTFAMFSEDLIDGLVDETAAAPEDHVMLNELRITCTMAMLLCLDAKHRASYVLGDILECDHAEGAEILEITTANFRKRLSRARTLVQDFTARSCGLANTSAKCHCPRRLPAAMSMRRLGECPSKMLQDAPDYATVKVAAQALETQLSTLKLQQSVGGLKAPKHIAQEVVDLVTIHP
ncbi:RNA polymerase sigma factor [Cognatishimia sp. WU-CL00825]|uniref:RNA polymerase sigma factor n=1 Tax=Cognatishimia sp. WU-CL00825 TaxID=3127658 RepID=UPI003365612E